MVQRPQTQRPWMCIVEQEEKPSIDVETVLELLKPRKTPDTCAIQTKRPLLRGFPVTTTLLGIMVIVLGVMIMLLKSDMAVLKSDITDLKAFKAQTASLDPTIHINNIERRFDDMQKEEKLAKKEIVQLLAEVDMIKAENKQEKTKPRPRAKVRPPTINGTARAMKNMESLMRKATPRDVLFPDLSRAMSLDTPHN
jgi:cell division protein FtsB